MLTFSFPRNCGHILVFNREFSRSNTNLSGTIEGVMVRRELPQPVGRDDCAVHLYTAESRLNMVTEFFRFIRPTLFQSLIRRRVVHGGSYHRLYPIGANEDVAGSTGSVLEVKLDRLGWVGWLRVVDQAFSGDCFGVGGKLSQERSMKMGAAEPHISS